MIATTNKSSLLAKQARDLFTTHALRVLPDLARLLNDKFATLEIQGGSAREMQERRDAALAFGPKRNLLVKLTAEAWKKAQASSGVAPSLRPLAESTKFELMDNEVMENRILGSRLALRVLDLASWELNDLRLRIQHLENVSELEKEDVFRPEVLSRHLIEQWAATSFSRELWLMGQDVIHSRMSEHLLEAYHATNEFLVGQGVMAEIDLRALVKRTPSAVSDARSSASAPVGGTIQGGLDLPVGDDSSQRAAVYRQQQQALAANNRNSAARTAGTESRPESSGGWGEQASPSKGQSGRSATFDETRMQTATTPLAKARMRAQGVMGHLKRLLTSNVPEFDETRANNASPPLAKAIASILAVDESSEHTLLAQTPGHVYGPMHVEQAAGALRQRTSTLKKAASTQSEKATIEIVALMFQSILAEDRIPPAVRVWFARLQMPVLRVAISEPEFFGSLQHPARRLIDRMGSCVLGFDADISGGAMELEIKRIVQVIEQYPETGRRVFQLVYDEFQKFLSRFLSEQGSAARVVTIAQQVEQKETMAIQYTIEMRSMLNDMPVREEIREFLFKIWAEVLAIAAMRNGPQHAETIKLKRAAADLVWAASAKPNRKDRAKVIADLPKLLQLLRLGMTMLNMSTRTQDIQIKVISDTLADAFMSKTDAISLERIDAMAKRLANLEDYLSDEDVGDLPLDTESLVMMIGIDAADLEVITDGGSHPSEAMRSWAQELQLGAWFSLDHNNIVSHVQFAWRSDRKQLHLFASADGRNFLIQARRLAAYLQAGLLVPTEDEALTVRATREALAKIDANPERLLS